MSSAEQLVEALAERGVGLFCGVPCSLLQPLIDAASRSRGSRYVGAVNEGDAVALAAGSELGGSLAAVLMQNSGLGNAVNPLTSLCVAFRIPVLLFVSLRGDPEGPPDEPQHRLMGATTTRLLELMEVDWEYLPAQDSELEAALERARAHMAAQGTPFAFVVRKGALERGPGAAPVAARSAPSVQASTAQPAASASRADALAAIQDAARPEDILVATTGFTGRELWARDDRANQIYMVGSMGCAASLGLGLALARPRRRVIVIDGDGAALMRLGSLAMLGREGPANLRHVLLDNGVHESTGGQATLSSSVDFVALAQGCGYPDASRSADVEQLAAWIRDDRRGLRMLHVPTVPGTPAGLPRPTLTPADVAARLREHLNGAER